MSMLNNIKYVFQIPLEWFRRVAAFCFTSYGGNLIKITRKKDGTASFDVDEEELKSAVERLTSVAESSVTSLASGVSANNPGLDTGSWSRNTSGESVKVYVVSHVDKPSAAVAKLFLRELYISPDGRIEGIGQEASAVEVI